MLHIVMDLATIVPQNIRRRIGRQPSDSDYVTQFCEAMVKLSAGNSTVLTRLGKVAYWACTACAALFGLIAAVGVGAGFLLPHMNPEVYFYIVGFTLAGALVWLFGRAARYVLGNE
jgi:hypothetical protein